MNLGASDVAALRLGSSEVVAAYLGATQVYSAFSPADASGVLGWWRASEGVFKTGPAAAGDGETVATWVDILNGLTLTRTAASTALAYDLDGAPESKPALIGTGGALARTFASPIASPWVVAVVRLDWQGAASLIVDSSGTNRYFCSRYTSTLLSINSGSSTTGHPVVDGEWGLLILDWGTDGVFNWSGELERYLNSGTNANADFVWGRDYTGVTPTNYAVAELIVGSGSLDPDTRINLRAWASRQYGFDFPSDTQFLDTFDRANAGPDIGVSDSGHKWPVQAADTRILNNTLTYISPWTTVYAGPGINFVPRTATINITTRAGGGGGASTGWYYLVGLNQGDYDPCFHFAATDTGWVVQEFESAAVVDVYLVSGKNYGGAGIFRLDFNYSAGTVTVTDPDGIPIVVDWNNSGVVARNLDAYETPFVFYELLGSGTTNALIYQFDRVELQA